MSDPSTPHRRAPLPDGTIPVGLSLVVAGLATYAFFVVGEWAVGGEVAFEPLVSMWFAVFALAPGFFLPLEQELGRAISDRRARGLGASPVIRRVALIGAGLTVVVSGVIVAASGPITDEYFNGNWIMLVALVLAFAAYAPAHLARGTAAGYGRFKAYAVVISADGLIRIALCVAFALIGITAVGWYAIAVAVSPIIPVALVAWRGQLRSEPGPPAQWSEVSQNLGWLLMGTTCAAALLNAGPVTANLLSQPGDEELVVLFGKGVLIARVPLFLFQAVQAALLPRLSRLAAAGHLEEFKRGLWSLMTVVAAVGTLGTIGAFVLGPWVVELIYRDQISGRTMAMLALSSALYMAALATAQAVLALQGHRLVAAGWLVGVATFFVGTWLSSELLFRRIEIGLALSALSALIFFGLSLRHQLGLEVLPRRRSLHGSITDIPIEY